MVHGQNIHMLIVQNFIDDAIVAYNQLAKVTLSQFRHEFSSSGISLQNLRSSLNSNNPVLRVFFRVDTDIFKYVRQVFNRLTGPPYLNHFFISSSSSTSLTVLPSIESRFPFSILSKIISLSTNSSSVNSSGKLSIVSFNWFFLIIACSFD